MDITLGFLQLAKNESYRSLSISGVGGFCFISVLPILIFNIFLALSITAKAEILAACSVLKSTAKKTIKTKKKKLETVRA